MDADVKPWPKQRVEWMQAILRERFGHAIHIWESGSEFRLTLDGAPGHLSITRSPAFSGQLALDAPCGRWCGEAEGIRLPMSGPLPAPGSGDLPSPLLRAYPHGLHLQYDLFGLAYWMLSRQEEVGREDLDTHGRFAATASHAYRNGYLERPIVDEWLEVLGQLMERNWPGLRLIRPAACLSVSHDVDSPSRYGFATFRKLLRTMVGDVIKRRDIVTASRAPMLWRQCGSRLPAADPSNTFDWIMDVSESQGLKSAFYFICGRTDPTKDALYDPEHPAIRALMRRIHERGHEIGLHPSYNTYLAPAAIAGEAARLRRVCAEEGIKQARWGGRMHFLRWRVGATLQGWEEAGMVYDSSLGYADLPGFRCGTCHEYPAYDPVAEKQSSVRIRPLIAMECTIMAPRYMGLGAGSDALAKFRQLRKACEAVHGCFTLLWHNSELESPARRALYTAVLN